MENSKRQVVRECGVPSRAAYRGPDLTGRFGAFHATTVGDADPAVTRRPPNATFKRLFDGQYFSHHHHLSRVNLPVLIAR